MIDTPLPMFRMYAIYTENETTNFNIVKYT